MLTYYTNLDFGGGECNAVNSKNFCKLLKRVALHDFDAVRHLVTQSPIDVYPQYSLVGGVSQFQCFCTVMKVGVCDI